MIPTRGYRPALIVALAWGTVSLLGACGPNGAVPAVHPQAPTVAALASPSALAARPDEMDIDRLKNVAYTLPDIGAFELQQGQFEERHGAGATQVNRVDFLTAAIGDLNRDGRPDAAVALAATTGGSGAFVYLAALLDQEGQPHQAAAALVGDRIRIQKLGVEEGKITLTAKDFAKNDPLCCPSLEVTRTYQLEGGALEAVSETR